MKRYFLILVILATGSFSQAKATSSNIYTLKVFLGDKETTFYVRENLSSVELEMKQGPFSESKKQILGKEFAAEFKKIISTLPKHSNKKEYCSRSYIILTTPGLTPSVRMGCVGSSTEISKKLTQLSNSLLFFL